MTQQLNEKMLEEKAREKARIQDLQESIARDNELVEKWKPVLLKESSSLPSITESTRLKVTARLLENQEAYINESVNSVEGMKTWSPILMSLVRRSAPRLIAYDVCGVQPMDAPSSYIFALTARYNKGGGSYPNDPTNTEALYNKIDTTYSGTGTEDLPANTFGDYTSKTIGSGMDTKTGETATWAEMGVSIDRKNVEAKTRQLKAEYSQELAEDMKRLHGASADAELLSILSNEIVAEINREVLFHIYHGAKLGGQSATTPGTIDLDTDADGRWSVEKFKGLRYHILKDANAIALDTRRGKGNKLICSADVATALEMSGMLTFTPALEAQTNLNVDPSGMTYAGRMGTLDVYIDPYAVGDGYCVGYRGDQYDSGVIYAPYIGLQLSRAVNSSIFTNTLGFKTRYGLINHPFVEDGANKNMFYRKAIVTGL